MEGVVLVSNGQVLVSVSNDEVSALVSVLDYEAVTPSLESGHWQSNQVWTSQAILLFF